MLGMATQDYQNLLGQIDFALLDNNEEGTTSCSESLADTGHLSLSEMNITNSSHIIHSGNSICAYQAIDEPERKVTFSELVQEQSMTSSILTSFSPLDLTMSAMSHSIIETTQSRIEQESFLMETSNNDVIESLFDQNMLDLTNLSHCTLFYY